MHFLIGIIILFVSGVAIYHRFEAWEWQKQRDTITDKDVSRHQTKLAVYAVLFVVGVIVMI